MLDKNYIQFFSDLENNNNKDWFDKNRKTYENYIKKPFYNLVENLILKAEEVDPGISCNPKEAIFRINRDIRFSKDKSPYKLQCGALIAKGGKKHKDSPGMYLEASHRDARVYSGIYMLDKTSLENVRDYIAENAEEFISLINDKDFVKHFGEIRGEKNKIIPKHLKEAAETQPLIANKSFYYFSKFSTKEMISKNFQDKVIERYKITLPLNGFFRKALGK